MKLRAPVTLLMLLATTGCEQGAVVAPNLNPPISQQMVAPSDANPENGPHVVDRSPTTDAPPEPPNALTVQPRQTNSSSGSSAGGATGSSNTARMWITDIQLANGGGSISGGNSAAVLKFDPTGDKIALKLTGKLVADHPPSFQDGDFKLPGFPLVGLVNQTFTGIHPHRRVTLDDSILLPLAETLPSTESLTVILDPKAIVDLAIDKLHTITVWDRNDHASIKVRVHNSIDAIDKLQPVIAKAEIVNKMRFRSIGNNGNHFGQLKKYTLMQDAGAASDATSLEDEPGRYLRIEGRNFPLSIYEHWCQINGQRVYAHATWIVDDPEPITVLFVHLPEEMALRPDGENRLSYANPFGFSLANF